MNDDWTYEKLNQLIVDKVEENLNLDYKGAEALSKSDLKKKEITKDISAMANSDSGIIIYGIKEFDSKDKKHLPEKIDPVNRQEYSKEWIEHIINNIKPKIVGVKIIPIPINKNNTHCVYVVDIPKSTTAHQATDFRYYRRFNFESVPMIDYEIKDIMNRAKIPNVNVKFKFKNINTGNVSHDYNLEIILTNNSEKIVTNFKLEFIIPEPIQVFPGLLDFYFNDKKMGKHIFKYISKNVLFPKEIYDIGKDIQVRYRIDNNISEQIELNDLERKSNLFDLETICR